MEGNGGFGPTQLFLADSRLALIVVNHLRHKALHRMFGVSRDQGNVITAVLLLGAADGAYEATRRVTGMRPHVSRSGAALGASALRGGALGVAGPTVGGAPAFGTLMAVAILGGLAAPGLRRTAHKMHVAEQRLRATEQRVRRERIRRYEAARDHLRASAS